MPAKAKVKAPAFIPQGTIVKVDWADAWTVEYDDGNEEPLPLSVLGFVATHSDKGIKLVAEVGPTMDFRRKVQFIPACNILKISPLKLA